MGKKMETEPLKPMTELLKEFGRIAVFAVIPLLIIQLESGKEIEWKSFGMAAFIAILRSIDRYRHIELINAGDAEAKGLLPF